VFRVEGSLSLQVGQTPGNDSDEAKFRKPTLALAPPSERKGPALLRKEFRKTRPQKCPMKGGYAATLAGTRIAGARLAERR
jgi:hypothetical protein